MVEPISIQTGDELQQLAEEMNRMNAQLMKTFSGLSDTVEEKSKEVRALQLMNQQILESVPNPIVLLREDNTVEYLNDAARQAFMVRDGAPEVGVETMLGLDLQSTQRLTSELEAQWEGLLTVQPEVTAEAARDPLAPRPVSQWQRGNWELRISHRIYRYQWFRIDARPGERSRIGLMFQDITDERRLQDKVVEAEKSSGLSLLASGIGHELNNPLSGILGLSEAILEESDPAVMKDHAKTVVAQAKRMADVIAGLTGQGRERHGASPSKVELNGLIEEVVGQLKSKGGVSGLDIRTHCEGALTLPAAPEQIRQVLVNVLTNSVHAMNGCGRLDLTTETTDGHVTIKIQDTGCGIPMTYLPKVFDPFFTTKRQGEGRGLGLTTARRIVESLGGEINILSQEGEGTTVVIAFPVVEWSPTRRMP